MSSLDTLKKQLEPLKDSGHAPVHLWHPEHHGKVDIVIHHDGSWTHEGGPIKREALVRLFASVLWFENGEHYLKTPAEQMQITVETTPFLITQMAVQAQGTPEQTIVFTTSYNDTVVLGPEHDLWLDKTVVIGQEVPLVGVRYEMCARLVRSVYLELIELGELVSDNQHEYLRLISAGKVFQLPIV
jgi:hypothetical protein